MLLLEQTRHFLRGYFPVDTIFSKICSFKFPDKRIAGSNRGARWLRITLGDSWSTSISSLSGTNWIHSFAISSKKSLYLIVDELIFICVRNAFIKLALMSQTIFIYTILSFSLELSSVRKIGQQFQHFSCVDNYRGYKLGVYWFF